jgi:hypothetical protein
MWRLCGNAKCRRAAPPRQGLSLLAAELLLLPQGVRDFFFSSRCARG